MRSSYLVATLALSASVALLWWRLHPDPPPVPTAAPAQPVAKTASPMPVPAPTTAPPQPAGSVVPATPAAANDAFVIRSEADLALLLRDRGLEGLMEDIGRWGATRGYPRRDDAGNLMLEQPYEQYDEQTLRGLALNGDMWAQQFLAQRLENTRPGEASEWYRRAAANGSVYAMTQLGTLYNRVASLRSEAEFDASDNYLNQVYALKDSSVDPAVNGYAWMAVAELVGWDPVLGATASPVLRRRLSDDQVREACELAESLREDLQAQRAQLGLGPYDRSPPPLVLENSGSVTDCGFNAEGRYDLSGCREVSVEAQASDSSVWLCGQ